MKAIKIFIIMLLSVFMLSLLCGCGTVGEKNETTGTTTVICPWEKEGAKQPADYTWDEFEALSGEEQIAFQKSFGSTESFDKWLDRAQNIEKVYPWDEEGAKQPADYTWEEFEALSGEEQIAFQNSFESTDKLDEWLTANEP